MQTVIIDSADLEFFVGSNLDHSISNFIRSNLVKKYNTIHLKLDRLLVAGILDFLGNELMRVGFSENLGPTEMGIRLENLIDKFSRDFYN